MFPPSYFIEGDWPLGRHSLKNSLTVKNSVADPDPNPSDPHVFGPPGSGSFYHQAKIVRKTWIPTVSRLLFDFLSLKIRTVPSKVISRKTLPKKLVFCWRLEGNDENRRIRIHYSEAWICGSGSTPKSHGSPTMVKKLLRQVAGI
jgi:hypothetical protein